MRPIPALYIGHQECPGRPSFALWNIFVAIPGHPVFSTLSAETLAEAGYVPYSIRPKAVVAS